jgi:hypothetical protein
MNEKQALQQYKRRAVQLIEELRNSGMAPGWDEAKLSGAVQMLYRPDVRHAAYYEFEVKPAGFIILSTGVHDFPVPHWNHIGISPTLSMTRIAKASGEQVAKFYKMDTLAYAAENAQGELVAQISQLPPKVSGIDPAWFRQEIHELAQELAVPSRQPKDDSEMEGIRHELRTTGSLSSSLTLTGWNSWREMKQGFVDAYGVLIEELRRDATEEWETEKATQEYGEGLERGQTYKLALLNPITKFDPSGEGVRLVDVKLVERRELPSLLEIKVKNIPPSGKRAPFQVVITYANGESETVKFFVTSEVNSPDPEEQEVVTAGARSAWSNWTYYLAGNDDSQRDYDQFDVGGCASGCGPTAWAMLFGWADYQASIGNSAWKPRWGIYRENGGYGANAVAPKKRDAGMNNVIKEIRNYVNTFCALGQGATAPWSMRHGWKYLNKRAAITTQVDYSPIGRSAERLRQYVRNSIRDRKTPAIIGTGWLNHYPLAWKYASRSKSTWWGTKYERSFYVNQGWSGSNGDGWVKAKTWFAASIYP